MLDENEGDSAVKPGWWAPMCEAKLAGYAGMLPSKIFKKLV